MSTHTIKFFIQSKIFKNFSLFVLCLIFINWAGAVVYVKQDATGNGSGSSWENACTTIGAGIAAAVSAGGDEVWVCKGTYTESVTLQSKVYLWGGFNGTESDSDDADPEANPTIIDGTGNYHTVIMDGIDDAEIWGFTITGGNANGTGGDANGGGIFCVNITGNKTIYIYECIITNNTATGNGGGIYCYNMGPRSEIYWCEISNNDCLGDGGGIYCFNASPTIDGNDISGNNAANNGGGIYLENYTGAIWQDLFTRDNSVYWNSISHNTAGKSGGGFYFKNYKAYIPGFYNFIQGNNIYKNTAMTGGGITGISSWTNKDPYLKENWIADNVAVNGGGLASGGLGNPVERNTIVRNFATENGGGIYGSGQFRDSLIFHNQAGGYGGGFAVEEGLSGKFHNSIFYDNSATKGGGVSCDKGGNMEITNSVFNNNRAQEAGGAVYINENYTLKMTNDIFTSNSATQGGAVWVYGWWYYRAQGNIAGCDFSGNRAEEGGAMYFKSGIGLLTSVDHNRIIGNRATTNGGAIYFNGNSNIPIVNNTLVDNSAAAGGGVFCANAAYPNIRNNIFTKTSGTVIYEADANSDPSVTYNDFWYTVGNVYFDEGTTAYAMVGEMDTAIAECHDNMAANPLFISDTMVKATWSADATFDASTGKTILTNSAANWTTDSLRGIMVNPNITQPSCFTIINNTQTQLIVWGNATAIAHIGDTYQLVHVRLQNEAEGFPANSPCIDAGDPADDYSQEPEDNGDRINQGRYGGTTEAERTSPNVIIEGYIKTQGDYPVYGVTVTFSNGGPVVTTNNAGFYFGKVPFGWSGTVTPARAGFTFNPPQRSYTNITLSVKDQNFQAITCPERLYVNDDATGTGDGSSWANACKTLEAVALYRVPEIREIWFAEGRYIGSFTVPNNTRVYGGFAGNETALEQRNWRLYPTIIDGNGAYHVVLFGGVSNSRLDGFVITGGVGNGPSWDTREGAGIRCWGVDNTCVIANNVILDNYAVYKGAGIFCVGGGNPKILNNIISGNSGGYYQGGAGINCEESSPEIRGNILLSNSSENSGGAVYLQANCVPLIINNIFAGNYTGTGIHNRGGGAICCDSASPQIINNTFTANTTASNDRGGAISVLGNADPIIRNNIFFKNARVDIAELSGDADPIVTYNNFYADADGFYRNENTTNYYDVSAMDAAIAECANNTQNDPLFVGEALTTGFWTAQGIYNPVQRKTVMYASNVNWTDNQFAGKFIIPNIAQLKQAYIVSNTSQTLTVWGNFATLAAPGNQYQIYDYHLQGIADGYPQNSLCIDAGDPADDYSQEPLDNGGRINQGNYGNTSEATRTSTNLVIYGYCRTAAQTPVPGVEIVYAEKGGTVVTNANGYYQFSVPAGWSGTATPQRPGFIFNPPSRSYTNVTTNMPDENYEVTIVKPVIYVDKDATGNGSGTSWENACTSINAALNLIFPGITEMWVAEGRYVESITLRSNLTLYGGFVGTESERSKRDWKRYFSIIDGNGAFHTVTIDKVSNAGIDGFIITGGNANAWNNYNGGGIFCQNPTGPITIANNVICNNSAYYNGGGIYCIGAYSGQIHNNIIVNNTTGIDAGSGGGINLYDTHLEVTGNILLGNTANSGGAIYTYSNTSKLINNIIAGNIASYASALNAKYQTNTITNNTFVANYAESYGTIVLYETHPPIQNNLFAWNNKYDIYEYGNQSDPPTSYNNFFGNADGCYYDEGSIPYTDVVAMDAAIAECHDNIGLPPQFVSDTWSSGNWTTDAIFMVDTVQTLLTDTNASWTPDALRGCVVNPDTTQPLQYYIVSNTATTLTVWGNATAIATTGKTYKLYDYHLQTSSLCVDAGCYIADLHEDFEGDPRPLDTVPEPRGDGSNYDIGADEVPGTMPTPTFTPTPIPSPTPTLTPSPDAKKVLIVTPDVDGGNINKLLNTLALYPDIAVTVWYPGSKGEPTVADLLAYNVVIIGNCFKWGNMNKNIVGNNLADYIDRGGKVIETLYINSYDEWGFGGRYMTDGYSPFTIATKDLMRSDSMIILDAGHPIMAGVTQVNDNAQWGHQDPGLRAGATLLAKWKDSGQNYIAFKESVVALNQLLMSEASWSGDVGIILHNAILWLSTSQTPTPTPIPTQSPTPVPTATPSATPLAHYTFETNEEGWQFSGQIPPFDVPASAWATGVLGLSPQGSRNCFSFWLSPDVPVENQKLYRSRWLVGSTVSSPDEAVQFRLRVNQKGAWTGWDRVVNSNLSQAPAMDNPKLYDVYFNPRVTGTEDNRVIFSFDIASFAWEDDANAWNLLEELLVEEITLPAGIEVQRYDFTTGSDGWEFQNAIPPFDPAISGMAPGLIGLSPAGSVNCFSYWVSPEVPITANKIYRVLWQVGSTVSNADDTVQFRLRINQKGAWSAWDRIVNSLLQNAPSATETKTYEQLLDPVVTYANDNQLLFSFDIISFDASDDRSSWLFIDAVSLEEITLK